MKDALSTAKYAEHKLDEAIRQGEPDETINYWRGYRDCAVALSKNKDYIAEQLEREKQHRLHAEEHADKFMKECKELEEKLKYSEERARKAEMKSKEAIQYMRNMFGWCTGCVNFTGIYGSGCKIGKMSTCGEENRYYVFCKEE